VEVEADVETLKRLVSVTPSLDAFLKDPSQKSADKLALLHTAATKLQCNAVTMRLLSALEEGGRFGALPDILEAFLKLASGTRGESTAVVTTFEPLNDAQKKSVGALLAEVVGAKAPLQVETKVDPAIMGGMIVEIGDKYVDLSVRNKLRSIDSAMATL
jgi:ATP synthase F1 delta subunit